LRYGIIDTHDNLWLADKRGLKTYDTMQSASMAARVYELVTLRSETGRFRAKVIAEARFKDVPTKRAKGPLLYPQLCSIRKGHLGRWCIFDYHNFLRARGSVDWVCVLSDGRPVRGDLTQLVHFATKEEAREYCREHALEFVNTRRRDDLT
jgi:hypothetical protein